MCKIEQRRQRRDEPRHSSNICIVSVGIGNRSPTSMSPSSTCAIDLASYPKEEAAKDDTNEVEPEHRLREEEETVLIEVLVASLSKATGSAATTKKVSSCVPSR